MVRGADPTRSFRAFFLFASGVFGEAGFYERSDEGGRERVVGVETDGAFAGVVVCEIVLVGFDGGAAHEVEGAVFGRGAEGDEQAVVAEGGELVADAFFGFGGGGFYGVAEFLEGGALGGGYGGETLVDGFGFAFGHHDCFIAG